MLRRLALALLLVFVATPSLAGQPCHQSMSMMGGMHHYRHGTDDRASLVGQPCIGCAIQGVPALPTASPAAPLGVALVALPMAALVPHSLAPETPPPRA